MNPLKKPMPFFGFMAVMSLGLSAAAAAKGMPSSEKAMASPALDLQRQAYSFPFATRDAWLAFVRTMPGGASVAGYYEGLFGEDQYARYLAGSATRTQRITYRNDGLTIKGLMVSPTTPGPHPVIIYNHGGVMEAGRIILPEVLEFNRLAERGYIVLASAYRGEGAATGSRAWTEAMCPTVWR